MEQNIIKRKKEGQVILLNEPEKTVDNQIELLKHITEVQSEIRRNINTDFILAKLDDKNKEGIIEMATNAYYAKKIIEDLAEKSREYNWNEERKGWILEDIDEQTKKKIIELAKKTFDTYMVRMTVTAIVNRNIDQNYIIDVITGNKKNSEEIQNIEAENENIITKLKNKLKPENKQK